MEIFNEEKRKKYQDFIKNYFFIVNKEGKIVRFDEDERHWRLQSKFLLHDATGRDVILKARQQGFSSIILALFTVDFLLKPNSYSMVIADVSDNAIDLLERVKFYIKSAEKITGHKVLLKYESKYELFNEEINSRYKIGTAENKDVGISKTLSGLHLSEFSRYPDQQALLSNALQAVVPEGKVFIETTANGFNFFKTFWDECVRGERPFNPLFYKASDFYDEKFLEIKKQELKERFPEQYPETPQQAFLFSGTPYFDQQALKFYIENVKEPIDKRLFY